MRKILIIEDDSVLREATADFLTEEGFKVFTAEDGMVGIKTAIKNLPDLILCDIEMPSFNGYEVFSILQENKATRLIPFIFLTARAESEDIRDGMQKGVDDYITKPFDYDELIESIKIRIAKRERLIKASVDTYKVLFENSLTGVFVISERKFVYINKKFVSLFGFTQEELNSQNWLSLIAEDDKKQIYSKIRNSALGLQKTVHAELKAFTKKRKLIDILISTGFTTYKGKPSLIGNVIEKRNENSAGENQMWLKDIKQEELENLIEIFENNQELLSEESVEKLKKVYKNKQKEKNEPIKEKFTKREFEVLELFCQGLNKHQISEKLFLSVRTVERHRARLIEKTETSDTVGLVLFALKNRLVDFD